MNIRYSQIEKKSQAASYLLAVLAVATALMMTLSLSRQAEMHWSAATSGQADQIVDSHLPVAISAPMTPSEKAQIIATPESTGNTSSILAPQIIAVPVPSVP